MSHFEAKMSSKGQITVPVGVRRFFQLEAGDTVDFYLEEASRSARMRVRNLPVSALFGALNQYVEPGAPPLTQEEMDKAIGDHLAEEDERITREWNEWQEFEAWRRSRKQDAAE